MGRGRRTGLLVLIAALVGVGLLGATGIVRIPYLSPTASARIDAEGPDDLSASEAAAARELAASGGNPRTARPLDASADAPADPVLPSEAKGSAIGRAGATIRGRVVESEGKRPVGGAVVELLMPEALFHYLRADPVGRFDRLTVQTDAEGRFSLRELLPAADYALRIRRAKGPYVTQRGIRLTARQVLDVGDVVLGLSGGLSGRVVGADGAGIADVAVAIAWEIENDFDAVMADPDTLPWVEAQVRTDAEGRWKAEGLEPGAKSVVARAPSGAADVKTPVAVVAGVVTPGADFTLGGARVIAGRAEWADGKPIAGARVFAKTMSKPASFTVESAADGSFRLVGLADGVYFVGAFIPGMSVQLVPGRKPGDEDVRIVVPLGGALTGKVASKSTGAAIGQFRVTPVFTDERDWMANFIAQKIDKVLGGAGFTSPDGAFRFARLKPGHYTLHVEAEGYPPTDSAPVEVVGGTEAIAPTVELPDGHRIAGFVRDATGAPIADAKIVIVSFEDLGVSPELERTYDLSAWIAERPEETRTDEKGAFRTEPLTPRAYRLAAARKGFMSRLLDPVDASAKSVEGVEFRLDPSGSVAIRVRDPRGRPVVGASVMLVHAEGRIVRVGSGPSGLAEIADQRPGSWAAVDGSGAFEGLEFAGGGAWDGTKVYERARAAPGAVEFRVEARGKTEVELRVSARTRIEGRVRLGAHKPAQRWFYVQREDGGIHEWVAFEEDGSFVIPSIAAGRYDVARPPDLGEPSQSWVESGSLVVPEDDVKGIEIDLSK